MLAIFRRRGLVRTGYDLEVGGVGLSVMVEWALSDPLDAAVAELVASTAGAGARTVRVRPVDPAAGVRGQTWVVSPPPVEAPILFSSHGPWPGRPRVMVRARRARPDYDVLVVVVGVCAVLAHRSLAFDVPGRPSHPR